MNLISVRVLHPTALGLCSIVGRGPTLQTTGKDILSKVGDYSWEDCHACQTTTRSTPTSASFSRDTMCAYCPFDWKSLRTNIGEGRLSVRLSSHEHPLLATRALGTTAIFSSTFLQPRRRIVPRKQRMAGRLGASRSESSFQINLTLEKPTKEKRGTGNKLSLLKKTFMSWLVPRTHDRYASSYGKGALLKKASPE